MQLPVVTSKFEQIETCVLTLSVLRATTSEKIWGCIGPSRPIRAGSIATPLRAQRHFRIFDKDRFVPMNDYGICDL